jgi:hypothetical protein
MGELETLRSGFEEDEGPKHDFRHLRSSVSKVAGFFVRIAASLHRAMHGVLGLLSAPGTAAEDASIDRLYPRCSVSRRDQATIGIEIVGMLLADNGERGGQA